MTWLYIVGYLLIGVVVGAVGIAVLDFDTEGQWGFGIVCSVGWPLAILAYFAIGLAAVARLLGLWLHKLLRKIQRGKRK